MNVGFRYSKNALAIGEVSPLTLTANFGVSVVATSTSLTIAMTAYLRRFISIQTRAIIKSVPVEIPPTVLAAPVLPPY
jgi:hypothetical protein